METLQARHDIEKKYWDQAAMNLKPRRLEDHRTVAAYSRTRPWLRYLFDRFGDLQGKEVLEAGCGTGDFAIFLARSGAHVTAIDVSPKSIELARERARRNGLHRSIDAQVVPIEQLTFEDERFDLVFGASMIHHVDISRASQEVYRVLKPNGYAGFVEPLGHNLPLEFARKYLPYPGKLPHWGTTHKSLRVKDADLFRRHFPVVECEMFQLFSMVERPLRLSELGVLRALDGFLLHRFPYLKRYCRWISIYLRKAL
jgi:ubiquinone/menaquinone biosynthesis C-methylase UbiE